MSSKSFMLMIVSNTIFHRLYIHFVTLLAIFVIMC